MLDELVAHEEALQVYGAAEQRGASSDSLEAVRAVIARLPGNGDCAPHRRSRWRHALALLMMFTGQS